ncbi:hypothetical protein EON64_13985 [archaeon]|nr:MAG: hypothetical protein EON64_13985 [archaeon]
MAFGRSYRGDDGTVGERLSGSGGGYRVGNTQGQISRDHHARLNQTTMGVEGREVRPLSHYSGSEMYDSSHRRSGSKGKVWFNWTS